MRACITLWTCAIAKSHLMFSARRNGKNTKNSPRSYVHPVPFVTARLQSQISDLVLLSFRSPWRPPNEIQLFAHSEQRLPNEKERTLRLVLFFSFFNGKRRLLFLKIEHFLAAGQPYNYIAKASHFDPPKIAVTTAYLALFQIGSSEQHPYLRILVWCCSTWNSLYILTPFVFFFFYYFYVHHDMDLWLR